MKHFQQTLEMFSCRNIGRGGMRVGHACLIAVIALPAWGELLAADQTPIQSRTLLEVPSDDMAPGLPRVVRVYAASMAPKTATMWHTHPYPVTVVVTQGTMIIEMDGREPKTITAGEAWLEPINVRMRGVNPSDTERVSGYLFQVADPNHPFLTPTHQ